MTQFQLNDDDVVSIDPEVCVMPSRTMRITEIPEGFKELFQSSGGEAALDILSAWLGEGVECEFLRASTGGGWQTGRIRVRFEIIPDVPEFAEPQTED